MKSAIRGLTLAGSLVAAGLLVASPPGRTQDPAQANRPAVDDDERQEQLAHARQILEENCLICHSRELIEHQRLTPAQWKAEVTKMIGWGSPVPPEQADELTGYLAQTFGLDRPKASPDSIRAEAIAAALDRPVPVARVEAERKEGEALFAVHCATCHGAAGRGELGNNLVRNPALLDPASFRQIVAEGRHRMPGFRAVLAGEAADRILGWLQSLD